MIFMLFKVLFIIFDILYVVFALKSVASNDSDFLVEKLYKFLKDLYYTFRYG